MNQERNTVTQVSSERSAKPPPDVLTKVVRSRPPIGSPTINELGDIVFMVQWKKLGLTADDLKSEYIVFTRFFADFLGELLVRRNLEVFKTVMSANPNYRDLVKKFNHAHFGVQQVGHYFRITFHVSFLHRLWNQELTAELSPSLSSSDFIDQENP